MAVVIAYAIGASMGLVAGYKGGWWDIVLSRISDIILSFPVIVLYIFAGFYTDYLWYEQDATT